MTVGVPDYSLDSWGIKYVKKTKPTGSTSSGLNTKDPNWRDQKVHRPEDIGEGSKTHAQSTHTAQVGENKITDMHISHGGARGTTGGGYASVNDTKRTDEYRAPISTDEKGGHKGTKLTIGGRGRTTAGYRARQGGAHGTGTEKHPYTLPKEIKRALNLVIIKCKLLRTKQTYEQGGNTAQDKELSRTGDNPTGTKFVAPKIDAKDTKDTKYFSQSGALLGRGETGKLAYEAEHAKTTAFANRDKKPTN